jgi:hypothetical protein
LSKVRPTALLNCVRTILALSASAMMMISQASAADLRLRIEPAAARREQPHTSAKEFFEKFLKWRSQQSR